MYVKANPILSKMFNHCGLTLNEKGLFYVNHDDTRFEFLITEDHVKIAEIMGFDYSEFDAAKEWNQFFDLLMTNKYFRPSRFMEDPTEGRVQAFADIAKYLSEHPNPKKEYVKRTIEDMCEELKEFNLKARIDRLNELAINCTKIIKRLSGQFILKMDPNFPKTKLQEGFEKYHLMFPNFVSKLEFMDTCTDQELFNKFIESYEYTPA